MAGVSARWTIFAVLAVAGCQRHGVPARYDVVIREAADPSAVVQPAVDHATGHLSIRVLTVRCGIDSIVGTHAEFTPDRPLCDIRLRVRSDDATFHTFESTRQRLLVDGDTQVAPAADVMRIKRQADQVELGAHNSVELDVWFMPPVGASPRAMVLYGDRDTDPAGSSVSPAKAPSVTVPLVLR